MKRAIVILFAVSALISCGQQVKVWENPIVPITTANTFEMSKVEITGDTTFIHFHVHYPSMNSFTFGEGTYILVDGHQYKILGCDSFKLGEYISTDPETWQTDITLYFEPIPKNTRIFDLMEGEFKGAFNFFNVHQEGYKFKPATIPADYLADYPEEDQWPVMEYSENPVTIHFKSINFRKGMNAEFEIWHFDLADPHSFRPVNVDLDENGEATYTTKTYFPERIQITYAPGSGPGWASCTLPIVSPGSELSILVDMNVEPDSINDCFVGFKGYMAKFNKWQHIADNKRMYVDRGDATLAEWTIQHAKTVQDLIIGYDSVMSTYKAFFDKLCDTEMQKRHLFDYELRYFDLVAEQADSLFHTQEFLDFVLSVRPACFFSDEIYPHMDYFEVSSLFAGTDIKGLGPDLCRYLYAVSEIRSGKKVKKPFIENPDLANLFDRMYGDINSEIARNKEFLSALAESDFAVVQIQDNIHYFDLAEVAPENIQQAILDRYKGKVVLFDMWATWCGWCIKGHQDLAPYKDEIKDKDVVFVYVTSPSSPFEQWTHYVNDVPGEHYYLTDAQFQYLENSIWGDGGVPKYAVYDRSGNLTWKQLGWTGADPIKTEIDKALKR